MTMLKYVKVGTLSSRAICDTVLSVTGFVEQVDFPRHTVERSHGSVLKIGTARSPIYRCCGPVSRPRLPKSFNY